MSRTVTATVKCRKSHHFAFVLDNSPATSGRRRDLARSHECDLRRKLGTNEANDTFTVAGKSVTIVSVTSQLTPERTTSSRPKTPKRDETQERILLQPWFWMAVLCMIAMVLLVAFG